jgi:hypothetical protein
VAEIRVTVHTLAALTVDRLDDFIAARVPEISTVPHTKW